MTLYEEIGRRVAEKLRARANDCPQELCRNWTGDGCACVLLDLEPDLVVEDDE